MTLNKSLNIALPKGRFLDAVLPIINNHRKLKLKL